MARGYDQNKQRKDALASLGRALARRASSKCELCEASGVPLRPWEVPPTSADAPELDRCILICDTCKHGMQAKRLDANLWHNLQGMAWSEIPAVQVTAVRLLKRLAADDVIWARDTLEGLYLEEDIQTWIEEAS